MVMMTPRDESGTYAGPLVEVQAASTAGGGTALTTTAALIHLKNEVNWLSLIGRNFSTAVVVKYSLNPYLVVIKTTDGLAAAANLVDYSSAAQDNDTSTDVVLSSLSNFAANDFLMVGAHVPFRGVTVDIDSTNGTATALTVKYWNGTSWVDTSATDNTTSGGASLNTGTTITWTVPSAWTRAKLVDTTTPTPTAQHPAMYYDLFWTRFEWSNGLDSSTTLNSMLAMNRSTAYSELVSGQTFETAIKKGVGGIGCVEALTDAGTANLIVNQGVRPDRRGIALT